MSFENDVDLTLWEPFPDVPNTSDDYRGYAMTSSRDVVYISGGCSGNAIGSDNTKVNRSLISFNMSTRKWTELPNMNYHRWGHRLAVVEGGRYLFAIGGWGYKNNTSHGNTGNGKEKKKMSIRSALRKVDIEEKHPIEKLTSYEVYDVSNHVWKEAGELNEPRRDFAMTVDGTSGKIYIFGGVGTNGALSTAEVYNPYEGKWVYLNEALPEAKRWCHALLVGSLIHILDTGKNTLTYNTTTNAWLEDPPDESIVPRCPSNGKVCTTSSFSEGQVLVYGYPVKDVDHGTLSNRWMIVHIGNNKRCKSWTVLPPADEFMYYRCTASDGKLIIGTGNNMISFQITDNATEDGGSTVAPSSASSVEGSLKGGSVLSGGGGRIVEVRGVDKLHGERVVVSSIGCAGKLLPPLLTSCDFHPCDTLANQRRWYLEASTGDIIQTKRLSWICRGICRRPSLHLWRMLWRRNSLPIFPMLQCSHSKVEEAARNDASSLRTQDGRIY
jgi:hypothetical protein